nr:DUF4932 domain-containing protein [uncultured Psychroserpens sp.]
MNFKINDNSVTTWDLDDDNDWFAETNNEEKNRVKLFSEIDSIRFDLNLNETNAFKVILDKHDTISLTFKGVPYRAIFNEDYINMYSDKTVVEVPEIHELINIIIALTELSQSNKQRLVVKHTQYYKDVISWFSEFQDEDVVKQVDSLLDDDIMRYFKYKMDSYPFHFKDNIIKKSNIYNRVTTSKENTFEFLLEDIQRFAEKTDFKAFYDRHKAFYNSQIVFFEKDIKTTRILDWLNKNFPSTKYDCFKIVFSPLVGGNQSVAKFKYDYFNEIQAYVNYPYQRNNSLNLSKDANMLNRGVILFTELNHGYINPELDKYVLSKDFVEAFSNVDFWTTKGTPSEYYSSGYKCFAEYLNWSLVSLYLMDFSTEKEFDIMVDKIVKQQIDHRGFKHFREFNACFISLYRNKKKQETVADLYPKLIEWSKQYTLK